MKQKSFEKEIANFTKEIFENSWYSDRPNERRDALLSTIVIELGRIIDILEGRNADVKAENRTDA